MKPKILFYDLETSPNLGYVWQKWETNVIEFHTEWEILSVAYKFAGDSSVKCITRQDFKDKTDKSLCKALHKLMAESDIIVAHNGDEFDLKKSNARFIFHGLTPPKIPTTIDTKKVAKRYFNFNSNSLNDLGQYLKLGKKVPTGGFQLWLDCMAGKSAAWKRMADYNKQDVVLLEKIYNKFLPWMQNHPSLSILKNGDKSGCPNCGSLSVQKRGLRATHASIKQQYVCNDCNSWHLKPLDKPKKKK